MKFLPLVIIIHHILEVIVSRFTKKNIILPTVYALLIVLLSYFVTVGGFEIILSNTLSIKGLTWTRLGLITAASLLMWKEAKYENLVSLIAIMISALFMNMQISLVLFVCFALIRTLNLSGKIELLDFGLLLPASILLISPLKPYFSDDLLIIILTLWFFGRILRRMHLSTENLMDVAMIFLLGEIFLVLEISTYMLNIIMFLFIYELFRQSRILIIEKTISFKNTVIFLLILSLISAMLGLKPLYELNIMLAFLLLFLFRNISSKENLSWSLVGVIIFLSPPVGFGYNLKIELLESLWMRGIPSFMIITVLLLMIQLFFVMNMMKFVEPNLEKIKNKEFSLDRTSLFSILILLLTSLLFIPVEWTNSYGNLIYMTTTGEDLISGRLGLGKYIFWAEFTFWVIALLIYYKSPKKFWKKLFINFNKPPVSQVFSGGQVKQTTVNTTPLTFSELLSSLYLDLKVKSSFPASLAIAFILAVLIVGMI